MAIFSYRAIGATGKEQKGTVNAENMQQAKVRLKGMRLMPLELKEQSSQSSHSQQKQKSSIFDMFQGGVKIQDLALLTRQLATLIRARIQIVEAFNALIDQTENPRLRLVLSEIRQKVNEGSSMAKALQDYPKIFDTVYVNMVEAGESSGTLDVVLLRLADFTESQVKLKNKVRGAMTYPVVMVAFGSIMMTIIFTFVIPKITKLFTQRKMDLPFQTKICIWISDYLTAYWWTLPLYVFFAIFFFNRWVSSKKGRETWDALVLKMPMAGDLSRMINIGRFCSTLSTLLHSGVPILASMRIVTNLISNVHIQKTIDEARTVVAEGQSMVGPLKRSGHFPPMVTHMLTLGEKSGEIESMLNIIADNYKEQVETKLSGLTSVLEPIMMICMGGAVGFIVFAVVIPLMSLNQIR
jgi:general secretion pathway protein F